jgi:hypothetical protein
MGVADSLEATDVQSAQTVTEGGNVYPTRPGPFARYRGGRSRVCPPPPALRGALSGYVLKHHVHHVHHIHRARAAYDRGVRCVALKLPRVLIISGMGTHSCHTALEAPP